MNSRVTTDFFVSSLLRRAQNEGAFAFIERKGDATAGAIFVKIERQDRKLTLLSPLSIDNTLNTENYARFFNVSLAWCDEIEISEKLAREIKRDRDLWVVTIEDKHGRYFVDVLKSD